MRREHRPIVQITHIRGGVGGARASPSISFWEVAMLVERGRLELDTTVAAFRTVALRHGIHEEPLDGEIGISAAELPDSHADPADRMLVATAILRGLTLITADDTLLSWKLKGFRAQDATT